MPETAWFILIFFPNGERRNELVGPYEDPEAVKAALWEGFSDFVRDREIVYETMGMLLAVNDHGNIIITSTEERFHG